MNPHLHKHPRVLIQNFTVAVSWTMFILLMTAVYSGALTGYFAIRFARLPFHDLNSLADQLQSGRFRIITETLNDNFFTEVQHSNMSAFMKINEAINKYPPKLVQSSDEAIEFVSQNYGFVFISTEIRLKFMTAQFDCNDFSIIVDRENLARWQGLGFPKGSKHVEAFTALIVHLKDFVDFVTAHYEKVFQACPVEEKIHQIFQHQPLTFAHIEGVFYVCFGAIGVATIVMLIEIFWRKKVVRPLNSKTN